MEHPLHVTRSTAHANLHSWNGTYHVPYIPGVQKFAPLIVYTAICDLALRPNGSVKVAFAALVGVVYLNLLFQGFLNLEKGIIGGDWTPGNIALAEDGVRAIDFEATFGKNIQNAQFFSYFLHSPSTPVHATSETATRPRSMENWHQKVFYDAACGVSLRQKSLNMYQCQFLELVAKTFRAPHGLANCLSERTLILGQRHLSNSYLSHEVPVAQETSAPDNNEKKEGPTSHPTSGDRNKRLRTRKTVAFRAFSEHKRLFTWKEGKFVFKDKGKSQS